MEIILHSALPEGNAGQPPDWLHLIPAGSFSGADGRGPYHLRNPHAVVTASMASGKLPIDENHAIDHAVASGQPSPARGWIVGLESRADGIWGRVEWTAAGAALMSDRAYRGISPAIVLQKGTTAVAAIARASLTNLPNLPQLTTLHAQKETVMDLDLVALRTALGLPADADAGAILARAQTNTAAITTHSQQIEAIAAAAGARATEAPALVIELQAVRAAAGDADRMAATVVELQTQLQTIQADRARKEAITFVDAQIALGKPIAPLRDHYISRHAADPTSVQTELAKLPSLNAGGLTIDQVTALHAMSGEGDPDALTPQEKMVSDRMGIKHADYAKHKKKMREDRSAA